MLPNTYWQLEYIKNRLNTTPYINTGIIADNTCKFITKFKYLTTRVNSQMGTAKGVNEVLWGINSAYKFIICANNVEQVVGDFNIRNIPNRPHIFTLDLKNNIGSIDDNVVTLSNISSSTYPFYLFTRRDDSGSYTTNYSSGNLYYHEAYKNEILVQKLIPVIRISDQKVGLYDEINDVFYAGDNSETFDAGPILNAPKNIVLEGNPLTFRANDDVGFTANFFEPYQISINYDGNLGNASYKWTNKNRIQLTAEPNSNGQFKGWYIDSIQISTDLIAYYEPLSDTIIEARFEPIYEVTEIVEGNGYLQITRGSIDKNDIELSVLPQPNNHFVKYEIIDVETVEYTETPLNLHIVRNITVKAYFEEDDRFHLTVSTNIKDASVYISDNDVFKGTPITLWARPFPDYYFVKWSDEVNDNPRTIVMGASNLALTAIYQKITDTNSVYQYRCYVKDQLDMTALPKAFLKVTKFTIKTDLMTNANSTIYVLEKPENLNNGDVLVLYDPKGQFLYNGVIKSIDDKKITCSQMQSFYKGLWIYNVSPQDFLEHEIAVLLQDYADGKVYGCNYIDPLIAQRLGGITIDYVGSTTAKLPTDLDEQGNLNYTEKDMESFIYELYENYGIIFDFEINPSGPNYVHIKVPTYSPVKVGDNVFAIKDMSPITTIEETNKLIIYSADKVYKTTYIATKSEIVEAPATIVDRFDITKTKVVFSDDDISDLVANNLPSQMYNHKLTFTLLIKNFVYQFSDFNLGGQLDIYHGSDYYNSVLTGYEIRKDENQNITEVDFICGKVRQKLTQLLTLGKV